MRFHISKLFPAAVLSLAASPALLLAVDGVIEINQARALAGSVTPGDTPGFPVNIGVSGSYRLTSSLTVPDEGTSGLIVTASDVTIDLNGFSILGPTVCTGGPPVTACAPTGGGNGIDNTLGTPPIGLTVKNGTIRGMGSRGINATAEVRVENVRVESNGGFGVSGSGGLMVVRSEVFRNGNAGINGNGVLTVIGSVISGNKVAGVTTNANTDKATILDSTFTGNVIGIGLTGGGLVRGNLVSGNTSFAMILGGSVATYAGYYGNAIYGSGGTVINGVNLGSNTCNGTTCP